MGSPSDTFYSNSNTKKHSFITIPSDELPIKVVNQVICVNERIEFYFCILLSSESNSDPPCSQLQRWEWH